MKYICFCYYDAAKFSALTEAQIAEIGPNCRPHDETLRATGKIDLVASFSDPVTWQPQVSSGPYLPVTEQAGALFILEAENMEEALQIASKHPAANYGEHVGFGIEVRECDVFDVHRTIPTLGA
jgi:hypothetical protein